MLLTKYYGELPATHVLVGHDRRCQFVHGHNYQLWVTVEGSLIDIPGHPKEGMIVDFTDLKNIVKPIADDFDHTLIAAGNEDIGLINASQRIINIGARTTVENIAKYVFKKINEGILKLIEENREYNFHLHSIRMTETLTSEVTVFHKDVYNKNTGVINI